MTEADQPADRVDVAHIALSGLARPEGAIEHGGREPVRPSPGAERWAYTVHTMSPEYMATRTRHLDGNVTTARDGMPSESMRRHELLSQVPGAREAYDALVAKESAGAAAPEGPARTSPGVGSERPVTHRTVQSADIHRKPGSSSSIS